MAGVSGETLETLTNPYSSLGASNDKYMYHQPIPLCKPTIRKCAAADLLVGYCRQNGGCNRPYLEPKRDNTAPSRVHKCCLLNDVELVELKPYLCMYV